MDNGGKTTDRLIAEAAIPRGASALDIGCGNGVVTLRLAEAVGREGNVLGIDLNPEALEAARTAAQAAGYSNIEFRVQDIASLAEGRAQFDVITCRRVLMYLPDQVAALRALHAALRPGGVLVLQEHDASILHASNPLPLYTEARRWVWDTVAAEGANTATGFELHRLLSDAGFADIAISADALVETPSQMGPLAAIVKVMVPRIVAAGVASEAEMEVDTLEARLLAERAHGSGTVVGELAFGALARKAAA